MTRVLVTGAGGFVGRHVVNALQRRGGYTVLASFRDTPPERLADMAREADAVVHLAGVNRPQDPSEFARGNTELTKDLCSLLTHGQARVVLFASSIHANGDTPYGVSKRDAEQALDDWARRSGGSAIAFRFANIFGKWCRPRYNSAVATFCHAIATGEPYEVHDPAREVSLIYVDDVVDALLRALDEPGEPGRLTHRDAGPVTPIALGDIEARLLAFRDHRTTLCLPDFSDALTAKLYATYLSYLPTTEFGYPLQQRSDARGVLAEFVKGKSLGQIFVSRTHPGITRGNHFHHSKTEKFLVVEGDAVVRFRSIRDADAAVLEYPVSGTDFRVVDIPPGYTHSIENVGHSELVVVFWASEIFDPTRPDTFAEAVLHA